jgi:hypothetical protein
VCNKSAVGQGNQNHQYAVFGVTFVTPAIVAAVPVYVVRARACSLVVKGDGAAVGLISFDHPRQIVGVAVVGVSANKQCQCFALTKL